VSARRRCCDTCSKDGQCRVAVFCAGLGGGPGICYLKTTQASEVDSTLKANPKCDLLLGATVSPQTTATASEAIAGPITQGELQAIDSLWKGTASLRYLIVANSARANSVRRNNMRELWGRELVAEARRWNQTSKLVFTVGRNKCAYSFTAGESICGGLAKPPSSEDVALWHEQKTHQDLMFVDVQDGYRNSAAKMLKFYEQLAASSVSFAAVVKLDDDAIIFPSRFFDAMMKPLTDIDGKSMRGGAKSSLHLKLDSKEPVWIGNFRLNDRVIATGKWAVNKQIYSRSYWPAYPGGPAHIMNYAFVRWMGDNAQLLRTSQKPGDGLSHATGHVWMEDTAHALWFEQAALATLRKYPDGSQPACRLLDHRFPTFPNECSYDSITMGSVWSAPSMQLVLEAYKAIDKVLSSSATADQREQQYQKLVATHAEPVASAKRNTFDQQPSSFAELILRCRKSGPPSWGVGEKNPTVKLGLGRFNKPVVLGMEEVVKPGEQIEYPISFCGPSGQQTWNGRNFRNDDPRTMAYHPQKEGVIPSPAQMDAYRPPPLVGRRTLATKNTWK
jgi:hypothetical protein